MKWELKETKKNPATGKTQEYKILIETVTRGDVLEAKVTSPNCPRGQRPIIWHTVDVLNWLKQKGLAVDKPLKNNTLTDITSETKTFAFLLNKTKKASTTKSRSTSTSRSKTRKPPTKTTSTAVKKNTPIVDTE